MTAPQHEATVAPELGRFLSAVARRRQRRPAAPATVSRGEEPDPRAPDAPWVDLALRRDGARPLKLRGLLIHRTEVRAEHGRSVLQLFATAGRAAVVQIVYEPDEDLAARPMFRVAQVEDAADLRRFIERAEADASLAGADSVNEGAGAHPSCARLRLPPVLPGLFQPCHP